MGQRGGVGGFTTHFFWTLTPRLLLQAHYCLNAQSFVDGYMKVIVQVLVFAPTKAYWVVTSCFLLDPCSWTLCSLEVDGKTSQGEQTSCWHRLVSCIAQIVSALMAFQRTLPKVNTRPTLGSWQFSLSASFNTDLPTSAPEWFKVVQYLMWRHVRGVACQASVWDKSCRQCDSMATACHTERFLVAVV